MVFRKKNPYQPLELRGGAGTGVARENSLGSRQKSRKSELGWQGCRTCISLEGALRNRDQDPLEVAEISPRMAHLPCYGRRREGMGRRWVPGLFLKSPLRSSGLENSAVACPKVVN